jgi:hypothetical protein
VKDDPYVPQAYEPVREVPDSDKWKAALMCATVSENTEELVNLLRMLGIDTDGGKGR